MIQQRTDTYIKVCMKAWLLCESCVHAEETNASPRYNLIRECGACARACFAVVSKLVGQADQSELSQTVFDCLLHCRQCASECCHYLDEEDVASCEEVCRTCGNIIRELAIFSLN